jgi:hypothetical protein
VDGQDDRFATGGATPPTDNFGFFGGAPAPGSTYGPPPGQPYGAPPEPSATPFGAPVTPYAAPINAPAPASTKTGRRQMVVAAVLILLAVAAAGGGWNVWKQHQNIAVPATLGGLAQNHDPAVQQLTSGVLTALKKEDPGKKNIVVAYGDVASSDLVFLVGVRGRRASIQRDLARGATTGSQKQIGHNTCATVSGGIVCERTSNHLTEGVVSASATRTMAQASALLDEAWAKA